MSQTSCDEHRSTSTETMPNTITIIHFGVRIKLLMSHTIS